jgi:hypothetical protein
MNIGDGVRQIAPTIQGTVTDIVYDKDAGELTYLVDYADAEGNQQQRWFRETELEALPNV